MPRGRHDTGYKTNHHATSHLLRFPYNPFSYKTNNSPTVAAKGKSKVGSRRNPICLWLGEYARPLEGPLNTRQNYGDKMVEYSTNGEVDRERVTRMGRYEGTNSRCVINTIKERMVVGNFGSKMPRDKL